RVAHIVLKVTQSVRNVVHPLVARGIERQINITRARVAHVYTGRISLVEDIEEARPELDSLSLSYMEVLEQRDVEIAPVRSPNIERRLSGPRVGEGWYLDGPQIQDLLAYAAAPHARILEVHWTDCACTLAYAVKGVAAIPGEPYSTGSHITVEAQANRVTALEGRYAGHRPAAEYSPAQFVVERSPGKSRYLPVVRKVEDVGAVKWQHSPAPAPRVERVHKRRAVAFVGGCGSQCLAERVGSKVLEVLAGLAAQRSLQRVVVGRSGELVVGNVLVSRERQGSAERTTGQCQAVHRNRKVRVPYVSSQEMAVGNDVDSDLLRQVTRQRSNISDLENLLEWQ